MHPHSIFTRVRFVVGKSEASGVQARQPLSNTTCMPFLCMKTTAHPRSRDLACQTIPYSYTRSFYRSFNHDIMSFDFLVWKGAQMQLLVSLHKARRWERSFAALAQKLLHITRMRDKCLKDFNETVIVDDQYPADGVGLMLGKCVHVANNTFRWFPEWWHCRMSKSCWLLWSLLDRITHDILHMIKVYNNISYLIISYNHYFCSFKSADT